MNRNHFSFEHRSPHCALSYAPMAPCSNAIWSAPDRFAEALGFVLSQNDILIAQAFEGREVHTVADLLRSNNPVLKEKVFAGELATGEAMTIQGTVNKTGLLLLFVVVTAAWTWGLGHSETPGDAIPWML